MGKQFLEKVAADSADTLPVVGGSTLFPEYKQESHKGCLISSKYIQTKYDILSK